MSDLPENTDPPRDEGPPALVEGATDFSVGETASTSPGDQEARPPLRKRKAPIVNRRGPSEVDRAIRMSQGTARRVPTARGKPAEVVVARGTIIRIDRAKGFGFLVDAAGEHRFFHRSAVVDNGFAALNEQQLVDFEPYADERGARAVNVRPAGSAVRSAKPPQRAEFSPKAARPQTWRSDLSPFRNGSGAPSRDRKRY